MAADLIVEWIQRDLVLVTFGVMLLMLMLMMMVDTIAIMMMRVVIVVLMVGLKTRRTTLLRPDATSFERTAGLHDPGKVMRVGELLLVVILQVWREFVGAASPFRR